MSRVPFSFASICSLLSGLICRSDGMLAAPAYAWTILAAAAKTATFQSEGKGQHMMKATGVLKDWIWAV